MPSEVPPPDGCIPIDHLVTPEGSRTFVRNGAGAPGEGLDVHYFRRESDGALFGHVVFGPGCQGPPGKAHGGSMAAVLDDAMGCAAWIAGHPVVAAEIQIQFKNMLPLGERVGLIAKVVEVQGKRIRTEGKLVALAGLRGSMELDEIRDEDVFSRGTGTFIRIGAKRFADLAKQANAKAES